MTTTLVLQPNCQQPTCVKQLVIPRQTKQQMLTTAQSHLQQPGLGQRLANGSRPASRFLFLNQLLPASTNKAGLVSTLQVIEPATDTPAHCKGFVVSSNAVRCSLSPCTPQYQPWYTAIHATVHCNPSHGHRHSSHCTLQQVLALPALSLQYMP